MNFIVSRQTIQQAKQLDLLTYLQRYEPDELVHIAGHEYTTKSHDSLKISNGKWHWFSKGVGGTTALDFLIHVRKMPFLDAVMHLTGQNYQHQVNSKSDLQSKSRPSEIPALPTKDAFTLPAENDRSDQVSAYLCKRGISQAVINHCLEHKYLYEDARYHNAVFVGYDRSGQPRHAMLRGTSPGSTFRRDAPKSNKRFTFSLPGKAIPNRLFVFEGAIDLLSHATIDEQKGTDWHLDHRLSLGGLAPLALDQYLKDYPDIRQIVLCLDRDEPGRQAALLFIEKLHQDGYEVTDDPPPSGKDYNDYLCSSYLKQNHNTEQNHKLYTR
ncbi:MAG: DUF3991 and toprim domain-containing protein [Clostridiaceae bacterium]|nr:DUF3991 and toprim domain-containing protein [Clostridiaceae bacterium]